MKKPFKKLSIVSCASLLLLTAACSKAAEIRKELSHPHHSETADDLMMAETVHKEHGTGKEEEIVINAEDHHIYGTWLSPDSEYDSAVILLHGFGADRECGGMFTQFAEMLAEESHMASFRFDFAGRGESDLPYSEFSLDQGTDDTEKALAWIREEYPGISHIYLLGHSMGGTIAIMTEAENPDVFDGIITWAGAADLTVLYSDEMMQYAKENGSYTMVLNWLDQPLEISYEWFEEAETLDLFEISARGTAPLLAIGGKLDDTVPYADAEKLAAIRKDRRSHALIYDDGDHMFRGIRDKLYTDTIVYLNSDGSSE